MKKLLVVMLVLGMASTANAMLWISVDGTVDPPDTSIELMPSEEVVIDIWGDGSELPGLFYLGISTTSTGAGSLDLANATNLYPGNDIWGPSWTDNQDVADFLGVYNPFVTTSLSDNSLEPPPLTGTLVDGIIFHCEGLGDVTITLFDGGGVALDSQVIHQVIPEPMTVALLGLGGLLLRRRK